MKVRVRFIVAVFLVLVVLECIGIWIPGLDVLFFLAVGWVPYLMRVGSQVHVRWDLAGSAAVYAGALVVGAHYFLRWLCREMGRGGGVEHAGRVWKWRWTLGGFSLVVLMFAAGIAAIGMVHQTNWLIRSPEPMYRSGSDRGNRVKCASNMRQIGQGLLLYLNDNKGGKWPEDLGVLVVKAELGPEVFVCPSSNDEKAMGLTVEEIAANVMKRGHCSYVYLGKGLAGAVEAERVIAVEPLENHDKEGMNVLFGDGHVEWLTREAAEELLAKEGIGGGNMKPQINADERR